MTDAGAPITLTFTHQEAQILLTGLGMAGGAFHFGKFEELTPEEQASVRATESVQKKLEEALSVT